MYSPVIFNYNLFPGHHQLQSVRNIRGLQYIGASSCQKKKFFVLFSDMNHVELKVPSPFGRPSPLVFSSKFKDWYFSDGEMVFNRLLGNGWWSDLDDFFSEDPMKIRF